MSTVEELLIEQLAEGEEPVCVIDKLTRKINMHEDFKFFGVENDKKVERIKFECPKEVGDENIDLTTCQTFIAYENANGEPGLYEIKDLVADGEVVHFSWLFDEDVTRFKGEVKFIFYACIVANDELENAWNTIPAQGFVEEGLDVISRIEESSPAIIESMLRRIAILEATGGGGQVTNDDFFIVKVNFDTDTANYSASEIKNAFNAGKIVITMDRYGMIMPLYDAASEVVYFEGIYESNGLKKSTLIVSEDKSVNHYTSTIDIGSVAPVTPAEITDISITEAADGSVTMVNTLKDGTTEAITIAADAHGNPCTMNCNGASVPITYTKVTV